MTDIPKKIGRYKVLEELGKGGMGVVYKARDPDTGGLVAVKIIRQPPDQDDKTELMFEERFRREARAATELRHPNIVSAYEVGEEGGVPFIAMEFMEGTSLDITLEQDPLSMVGQAGEIIMQVARGAAYAHDQGIIHRDLKPANIIITNDGTPRIMDFGIARTEESELTKTGTVLGSPNYMSPEQITGQKVDQRSDVFSLGTMLYQLLTGEKPFSGDNYAAITYKVANLAPLRPSNLNPVIDPLFDQVVAKCLAKRPDDRYQAAQELAEDLERLARGEELKEPTPELTRVFDREIDRTRELDAYPPDGVEKASITAPSPGATVLLKNRRVQIGAGAALTVLVVFLIMSLSKDKDPYTLADDYIKEGKHEKAVNVLKKIVEQDPENHMALFLLGVEHATSGDYLAGVVVLSRAIKLKPEYRDDEKMIKTLISAPRGPDSDIAVKFIVEEVGRSAVPVLKASLQSPEYDIRWNAAEALQAMNRRVDPLPLLIMDLNSGDCDLARKALAQIVELGDRRALPDLEAAREDKKLVKCLDESLDAAISQLENTKPTPIKDFKEGIKNIFKR